MKNLLSLFLTFVFFQSLHAQERVFKKDYGTLSYKHVKLANGNLVVMADEKIQDSISEPFYHSSTMIYLFNEDGVLIDESESIEGTYFCGGLHEIPNGNVVISTRSQLCDCGSDGNHDFIGELDVSGSISTINIDTFGYTGCFSQAATVYSSVFTGTYQLVLTSQQVIYFNAAGDSILTSFPNTTGMQKLLSLSPNRIITSNPAHTYAMDSLGNVLATSFGTVSSDFIKLSSNRYVAREGNNVTKRNNTLGLVNMNNFSSSSLSVVSLAMHNNALYVLGKNSPTSYHIIRLDTNLVKIDSVSLQMYGNIKFQHIIPYDNHFLLLGREEYVSQGSELVIKKYPYANSLMPAYSLDAALTDVRIDSFMVIPTNPPPAPPVDLKCQVTVTITNPGLTPIDTVVLSAETYQSITSCFLPYVSRTFYNLGLQPGDTSEIYIGDLIFSSSVSGFAPINVCAWAEMPGFKIDHSYLNNKICKNLILGESDAFHTSSTVNIYPNPIESDQQITIEFSSENVNATRYILRDISGREIQRAPITQRSTQIALNNISAGIFFIELLNEDSRYTTQTLMVK